jgi:hypothetical protein
MIVVGMTQIRLGDTVAMPGAVRRARASMSGVNLFRVAGPAASPVPKWSHVMDINQSKRPPPPGITLSKCMQPERFSRFTGRDSFPNLL